MTGELHEQTCCRSLRVGSGFFPQHWCRLCSDAAWRRWYIGPALLVVLKTEQAGFFDDVRPAAALVPGRVTSGLLQYGSSACFRVVIIICRNLPRSKTPLPVHWTAQRD